MKNISNYYLIVLLMMLICTSQSIFSQSTYDYIEKQRLERKEKKIKTISSFDYLNDALSKKEYYDENGLPKKIEIYGASFITGDTYLLQEIIIHKLGDNGNVSGTITKFESDGSKTDTYEFNDLKPEIFFNPNVDGEFYSDVQYTFDNSGKLSEKRYFNSKIYGPNEYEKQVFSYNSGNKLIGYKYYIPNNSTVSNGKFYYNSNGLLEKEESSYDFQKGERVYGIRYEYEFY